MNDWLDFYPECTLDSFFSKTGIEYHFRVFQSGKSYGMDKIEGNEATYSFNPPSEDIIEKDEIPVQYYPERESKELKINFFEDFLPSQFKRSFKKEVSKINCDLDSLSIPDENKYKFISEKSEIFYRWLELSKELFESAELKTLRGTIDFELSDYIKELEARKPYRFEDFSKDKIKLRFGKNEIYFLFKSLYTFKKIPSSDFETRRIAELLEKHFMFYDNKLKDYKEITGMYKYIQNLERDLQRKNEENKFDEIIKLLNKK